MQKTLITLGVLIILIGLAWPLLAKLPFGRLPGDIVIRRESGVFFFPLSTMLLLSVIGSLLLMWLRK